MLPRGIVEEMIASCKATSAFYYMTNIGFACLLSCIIVIAFSSSTVSAFRIVFPPFDNVSSLLSLFRDLSLVPPDNLRPDLNTDDETRNENNLLRIKRSSTATVPGADTVHFCFLVHGYQGLSSDLSYFETVLKHRACVERKHRSQRQRKPFRQEKCEIDDDFVIIPTATDGNDDGEFDRSKTQHMVVHNSVCNEGKTTDGVINGGDRLIDEIRKTINAKMKERHPELEHAIDGKENFTIEEEQDKNSVYENWNIVKNREDEWDFKRKVQCRDQKKTLEEKPYDITISIIGNSMGGLYGRYAIAKLIERHCVPEMAPTKKDDRGREQEQGRISPASWIVDGKYRLRLDIFCTTASPHLGVSQHTWIRIPRIAEIGIAATMGESGRDLFRLNNLLHTMATDSTFLDPLASFRKRIAYANCYGTDFPVPVGTAAFLSDKSTYPHEFLNNCKVEDECGLVIATLRTPANVANANDTEKHFDELHQMSLSLDRLGWEKVFVDLRKEMLSIELPRPTWVQRSQPLKSLQTNTREDGRGGCSSSENNRRADSTDLRGLKKHKTISSKDINNAANEAQENNNAESKRLILRVPVGHNMIVAFSRNRLATFLNKGGRPLVDALAEELVRDIFAWDRKVDLC
jgi:hypothetical protein